jgi:hypothetical protein
VVTMPDLEVDDAEMSWTCAVTASASGVGSCQVPVVGGTLSR